MQLIHRIWLGGEMPDKFKEYGEEWKRLNPDHRLLDWNGTMLDGTTWINQDVIDDLVAKSKMPGADMVAFYTQVADVLDYEILYRYGGWYFNCDLKPIKPLNALDIHPERPALAFEDDVHLVNMAMYAPKGDPLMKTIIDNLPGRYFGQPDAYMNATTGVQLIMQSVPQYGGPLTTFHRDVFNPIHFTDFDYGTEPDLDREFPESTVAVHLWGHRTNQRNQRVLEG